MRRLYFSVTVLSLALSSFAAAQEFTPPPQAERELVAAIGKAGGRATVDGEYRVLSVSLGGECTNEELKKLAACERLTAVSISSTKINDEGLAHLHGLKKLTTISITSSSTTPAGLTALRAALPDCRVTNFLGGRGRGGPAAGAGERAPGGGDRDRGTPPGGAGPGGSRFGGSGFGTPASSSNRRSTLLRNTQIQDELKLTPEQKTQISEATGTDALSAALRAIDEKTAAVLTPEQKARLKQLELQQTAAGILGKEVIEQLKLTDEQTAAIRKIDQELGAAAQAASREIFTQRGDLPTADVTAKMREKTAEFTRQREEKVQAVLTEEQRKAWKELVGQPGPVVGTFFPAESRFGGAGGSGGGNSLTPGAAAKFVFDRYDTNKDNSLSDEEFPESNRTRTGMKAAGITLTFPVAREVFEKEYAKYFEQNRRR